jgi:hypothetical protein
MNRLATLFLSLVVLSLALTGCRRAAEPDPMPEAEAPAYEEPVAQQPSVPMCGSWVVVVESPTVTGDLDGNRLLNALLDGLRATGCEAHTAVPGALPAGTVVLTLSPRFQAAGGGGNLSVIATDTSAGEVHGRHQERFGSGDGTAEARKLGEVMGGRLNR